MSCHAVVLFGEAGLHPLEGDVSILGGEVELGPVAGGDDHAFRGFGQRDQIDRSLPEFGSAHGEALAHLHGGGAVVEAEAEKFHQTNAKTASDSTNSTTAESENRRPVNPRTRLIPSSRA